VKRANASASWWNAWPAVVLRLRIGRYDRERALLVSAEEYRRRKSSTQRGKPIQTLEGTLKLECSPEDLIVDSRRLGDFWLASIGKTERKRRSGSK
jgi:hypothetical protein